jgi:GNAT superfamily N-acetyltransferase
MEYKFTEPTDSGGRILESTMGANAGLRPLCETDPPLISAAFEAVGWSKPVAIYQRYLAEQTSGNRVCTVATVEGRFAGYVTINWNPDYPGYAGPIPEIQDLNVLPDFRRRGIASKLLDWAEAEAANRSNQVGIGVGLHPGYNAAQRLYGKRGYVPDGLGIIYRGRFVHEGETIILDDNLVMHLIKRLG